MKMISKTHYSICLILLLLGCMNPLQVDKAAHDSQNPIRMALLLPISIERTRQEGLYLSTVLAAEEINNVGGVLGREIEIVLRDDGGSTAKGVAQARQLLGEGVQFILGPAWSSVTLAVANEVTIPNSMLLFSHSATNSMITTLDDNGLVWRTALSDIYQSKIGAEYVYHDLGKRTVGIIHSTNVWASGLAESFQQNFEQLAGPGAVVSAVSYPEGQDWKNYDFTAQLNELFAEKPEVVYVVSFISDGVKMTHDMFLGNFINDNYHPQFFSVDGTFDQSFLFNGQPDITKGMMGTMPTGYITNPAYKLFTSNFYERFGFTPESYSEHIYDAVYLIAYAMLKSGSTDPVAVAAELRTVSGGNAEVQGVRISVNEYAQAKSLIESGQEIDYDGATGKIELDENGDPGSGRYIIWKIDNGEYTVETTVDFP
jgi:ABC-type branched-subunit amino acid transport system substrate-binding protein